MDDFIYHPSEKVKLFEGELKADLAELKTELEENDLLRGPGKVTRSD